MTADNTKFNVTFAALQVPIQVTSFAHLKRLYESIPESERYKVTIRDADTSDALLRRVYLASSENQEAVSVHSPHESFNRFMFGTHREDNVPYVMIRLSANNDDYFYWCSELMFVEKKQTLLVFGSDLEGHIIINPIEKRSYYTNEDDFQNTSPAKYKPRLYHPSMSKTISAVEKAVEWYQKFASLDLTALGLLKAHFEKQHYPMEDVVVENDAVNADTEIKSDAVAESTPEIISEPKIDEIVPITPKLPFNIGFRTYPHGNTTDVTITSFAHLESLIAKNGHNAFAIRMIDTDTFVLHCQSSFCQYRLLLNLPLFFPEFNTTLKTIEYSDPKPAVRNRILCANNFSEGHHVEIGVDHRIAISYDMAKELLGIEHRLVVHTETLAVYVDSENKYASVEGLMKTFNCLDFIQPSAETYKDEWFVMAKRLRTLHNSLVAISKQNDEVELLRSLFERNQWPMIEVQAQPEPETSTVPIIDECQCVASSRTIDIDIGNNQKLELSLSWLIKSTKV